jgi:NhaP-type Na+/H+ and K+/H+ antiporter
VCFVPARLEGNERNFVLFAGLKGAVHILHGGYLLAADVPAKRLYGIVVVVVVFSVVVQGGLVPTVAGLLHLPTRVIEPEPWSFEVRLTKPTSHRSLEGLVQISRAVANASLRCSDLFARDSVGSTGWGMLAGA